MTKVPVPELIAEKETIAKEYEKLLADRKTLMKEYDVKMRETAHTEAYVNIVKERKLKVDNGIDVRLRELQSRTWAINKAIEDAKPKIEVKEEKKKKGKKDKEEEEPEDDE